jgi:hypothetical protein
MNNQPCKELALWFGQGSPDMQGWKFYIRVIELTFICRGYSIDATLNPFPCNRIRLIGEGDLGQSHEQKGKFLHLRSSTVFYQVGNPVVIMQLRGNISSLIPCYPVEVGGKFF